MASFKLPLSVKIYKSETSMEYFTIRGFLNNEDPRITYRRDCPIYLNRIYRRELIRRFRGPAPFQTTTQTFENQFYFQSATCPYSQRRNDFYAFLTLQIEGESGLTFSQEQYIIDVLEIDLCIVSGFTNKIRLKELWNNDYFKGVITSVFDKAVIAAEEMIEKIKKEQ